MLIGVLRVIPTKKISGVERNHVCGGLWGRSEKVVRQCAVQYLVRAPITESELTPNESMNEPIQREGRSRRSGGPAEMASFAKGIERRSGGMRGHMFVMLRMRSYPNMNQKHLGTTKCLQK